MITHLSGPRLKATIIVVISRQHIRTGRVQVPQASCFVKNPLILSGTELVVEPQKIKNYVRKSSSRTRKDSSGSFYDWVILDHLLRVFHWEAVLGCLDWEVEMERGKLFAALDADEHEWHLIILTKCCNPFIPGVAAMEG